MMATTPTSENLVKLKWTGTVARSGRLKETTYNVPTGHSKHLTRVMG